MANDLKARFEVETDVKTRTVHTVLSGVFSLADMQAWATAYRTKGTNVFAGRKHMCIADMRGMRPANAEAANALGAEIGHARRNGCVLCAHISDDTVQRLQAARVARQNSPTDTITVEVAAIEEAKKVCDEVRPMLDDRRVVDSAREFAKASTPAQQ